MIIMHESLTFNVGGARYALHKLQSSTSTHLTPEEKKLAERALSGLETHGKEAFTTFTKFGGSVTSWDIQVT
jgi:hypothetical protein